MPVFSISDRCVVWYSVVGGSIAVPRVGKNNEWRWICIIEPLDIRNILQRCLGGGGGGEGDGFINNILK